MYYKKAKEHVREKFNERQMESDKPHSQTMVPEVLFYQNYVILQELSNFMSYHKVFILKWM